MNRVSLCLAALALVVIAGCSSGNGGPSPQAVSGSPTAPPSAVQTPVGTAPSPTTSPAATATPGKQTVATISFLEVSSPAKEAVVRTRSVEVTGRTAPDAVVSVNGQPTPVDRSGAFTATVQLDEGPNSIEVIASDFQGHRESRVLSVIYVP